MISAFRLGEGVGGTCIGLYRFDIDGEEEVGFSTSVPVPRAWKREGLYGGTLSAHTLGCEPHSFGNEKQGSFSRNFVDTTV